MEQGEVLNQLADLVGINRLADLVGIEPAFWDIFGHCNEASPETKRALMAGMGLDVGSDAAIEKTLRAQEERAWERWIPMVSVLRRGKPLAVAMTLPTDVAGRRLTWTLSTEDGSTLDGHVLPSSLPPEETHEYKGKTLVRVRLILPDTIPDGYHTLGLRDGDKEISGTVVVAPGRSYLPDWLGGGERRWGVAVHLYSLRSDTNWGMGDFGDLKSLAATLGAMGVSSIGVNPLHSLFPNNPLHASPYSPSSRLFLNPLYIDVTAIPEFAKCDKAKKHVATAKFKKRLQAARATAMVDYPAVASLKGEVLEMLHAYFQAEHPAGKKRDPRRKAYETFIAEKGIPLRRFAIYQAICDAHEGRTWRSWPEALRHPNTPEVAAFAKENEDRVSYHMYLQFEADRQLNAVTDQCAAKGMAVGLYLDLAVGVDPQGSDVWGHQKAFAAARVGAPPDQFNANGQDWGIPPFNPMRMQENAYADFIAVVRAAMRHAGALRIDHVMALMHLYLIPAEGKAADGAYVHFPFDDLLGIVALESHRNACFVIGEDLGTVPPSFRERMTAEGILSYRVLFFERYPNGLFMRPIAYPPLALATASTHDLPTIAGYWLGKDLDLKNELGLLGEDQTPQSLLDERAADRELLSAALVDQGLYPPDVPLAPTTDEHRLQALILAVHRFLGRSASRFMMVNLDDLLVETTQLNLPGTVDQYPNWRRKLSTPIEALSKLPYLRESFDTVEAERKAPLREQ
ncbi:MAG: 4-alpha-glucanotransferase [Alphaproteobacteria bacterium]|nr:4-alpha-glucanotransferase [Alphaproteobacteria bacterium]